MPSSWQKKKNQSNDQKFCSIIISTQPVSYGLWRHWVLCVFNNCRCPPVFVLMVPLSVVGDQQLVHQYAPWAISSVFSLWCLQIRPLCWPCLFYFIFHQASTGWPLKKTTPSRFPSACKWAVCPQRSSLWKQQISARGGSAGSRGPQLVNLWKSIFARFFFCLLPITMINKLMLVHIR